MPDEVASQPAPPHAEENAAGARAAVMSMTGFGRAASREEGSPSLTLTLRSINHRFLDLHLRLPGGAETLEAGFRKRLKAALARGHVECTLTVERPGASDRRAGGLRFDREALRRYIDDFRAVTAEFGMPSAPDMNVAATLPGMLTAQPAAELDLEGLLTRLAPELLDEALSALQAMRAAEGEALAAVLRASLARLEELLEEAVELRAGAQEAAFARLRERLAALTGGAVDESRLLTEAALLAERGDVEEEAARLRAHIDQFAGVLGAGGETGKRLDFLLQEMNREANTLLSKTGGASANQLRLTECGLAMKAEIEKLREQVQNLE